MKSRRISRRAFLKSTATLAATGLVGLPERSWRKAWAAPGNTTVSQTIVGTGGQYQKLAYGPGEPYLLREDLGTAAQADRTLRRIPLLYFAQLSDTHVLDAQSPARVEYLDTLKIDGSLPFASAFRPQEMQTPFVLDSMVRQLNTLETSALSGLPLAFAINTGDTTDNQQLNELRWLIEILDGGDVSLTSGSPTYEGVQRGNTLPSYYHPDDPSVDDYGQLHAFPAYPGLVDASESSLAAAGLAVPWYAVFGNHDGLVQGTVPALDAFERIATGPIKIIAFPLGPEQRARFARDLLRGDPTSWRQLYKWVETRPNGVAMIVTPDPRRRFVSHREWIGEHWNSHGEPLGHGFTRQNLETDTGYYTFDPAPGIHCVVLDSVNPTAGANGSLDEGQFDWLDADLTASAGKITLVFAHHTIGTMNNQLRGPGDPGPRRLGADVEQLFWAHPTVVAFVNGHTHRNTVIAHPNPDGIHDGFWEINTAAHIDWPEQSRLIEVFDNADGTLSIFGTMVDHIASPSPVGLAALDLAAISRELAYNDPQRTPTAGSGIPADRNVELIIASPLAP